MNETLLDRAISNFKMAEKNFEFILEDDIYLNLVGYLLQQSTELALKHCIELSGLKYPKTHNIVELLGLMPEDIEINKSELLMMSGTITEWESKTMYIKNFRLVKDQLEIGFKVIGDLLNHIKLYYASENKTEVYYDKIRCCPKCSSKLLSTGECSNPM